MDLMTYKCRFGKKRYVKQVNDIWQYQKNWQNVTVWQKKFMLEKNQGYDTGKEGGGSRDCFAK